VGIEAGIKPSAAKPKSWWVYMVQTKGGRLYTGITTDPKRRFKEHCDGGSLGARFFRTDPAFAMVFQESQPDRSAASKREAAIKKLTRQKKMELVKIYAAKSSND
jgi:putative endonuclease